MNNTLQKVSQALRRAYRASDEVNPGNSLHRRREYHTNIQTEQGISFFLTYRVDEVMVPDIYGPRGCQSTSVRVR